VEIRYGFAMQIGEDSLIEFSIMNDITTKAAFKVYETTIGARASMASNRTVIIIRHKNHMLVVTSD